MKLIYAIFFSSLLFASPSFAQTKTISDITDADLPTSDIQTSEPNADAADEENAPGRTPGKAEGSREIIDEDLAEKENE